MDDNPARAEPDNIRESLYEITSVEQSIQYAEDCSGQFIQPPVEFSGGWTPSGGAKESGVCPQCGAAWGDDNIFCDSCGVSREI